MIDIKLLTNEEKELKNLIQAIRICSQHIGMEFSIEKCAMLLLKSGKIETMEGTEIPNQERIRTLREPVYRNRIWYWKMCLADNAKWQKERNCQVRKELGVLLKKKTISTLEYWKRKTWNRDKRKKNIRRTRKLETKLCRRNFIKSLTREVYLVTYSRSFLK